MRVATLIELRSLLRGRAAPGLLILTVLFAPLSRLWELFQSRSNMSPMYELSYAGASTIALALAGLTATVLGSTAGAALHQHKVHGAWTVTGFPRDLLILGRIAAVVLVALCISFAAWVSAVLTHVVTHSAFDRGTALALSERTAGEVAWDLASILLLALVGTAGMTALASLVRSGGGAVIAAVFVLIADRGAQEVSRDRWNDAAMELPLIDAMTGRDLTWERPWWSPGTALERIVRDPVDETWWAALALLSCFVIALTAAAIARSVRGDA